MIAFRCTGCGKALNVKDQHAGKRGSCPHCKQPLIVPAASLEVTAAQAADTPSAAEGTAAKLDFLAPPQQSDELGRLGSYRVLKVLGAGGMGLVLQAEDPKLKRLVALKVMRPELAAKEVHRQRFLREAQATAAVEHPNIIHIHQVGEERGVPFLAMPFLKGEALDARLQREPKIAVAEAARIARQVAEGLAAAHEAGLIHRDIKPANLWLEARTGLVKVLDFGLARVAADDTQLTQSGTILGTPAYMAPEQASGTPVDGRCDLFSLGAVLYRMLTGTMPFPGTDIVTLIAALLTTTPRPVRELNPAVPPALAELVMQMLARDPAARPASARAVADALAAFTLDQTPVSTIAVPAPARGTGRRWKRVALFAALVLLGVGISVLAAKLGFGGGSSPTSGMAVAEGPSFINSLRMEFVRVPRGKFLMGGGDGNVGDKEAEIAYDFYLGKYEVTQAEWQALMSSNPSWYSRSGDGRNQVANIDDEDLKRFPVENISWDDIQQFLEALNARDSQAGWTYRLPREAEWEYACRGGPTTNKLDYGFDYYIEKPTNQLQPEQANFNRGPKRTVKVGSYPPNRLGLHDMHGNVWEWCADAAPTEEGEAGRVFRGGSYKDEAKICAAAIRNAFVPTDHYANFGFRVALVPIGK
jgi:formylglycine-generating enzyme required for sulfatase activity